jgi:DNA-directed RNA polymerase subunit B
MKRTELLLQKFFDENSLVASNISSFNHFIESGLQEVIDENKELLPPILPTNIEDFKIHLDKIWVGKPEVIEADGSKREILPMEARLRKLTYASPVMLSISAHINGVQRESFTTQIASMPIMLKSKKCFLNSLSKDELVEKGEDPDDPGGYFIINGTEKVLISVEDLMPNNVLVEKDSASDDYTGKIFSEHAAFKIPHTLIKKKDGIFYLSFTRVKEVPLVIILKALGLVNDEDIVKAISADEQFDELLVNLYEFVSIKNEEDALDIISKKVNITQPKQIRIERTVELLDKYLLPHIGCTKEDRTAKAYNLCKMLKKFIKVSTGQLPEDDKDHYKNKNLKLSGELLMDLFRANLRILIGDMLYNFQRIVKRGKVPSIKVIIREKLLTSRIYSSMATGSWVGGRKGIAQRLSRVNFLDMLSHLQRVVSPLSTSQENFEARELHPTHLGRLCPAETPEGTNIGLRKNLALLAQISQKENERELISKLADLGLKAVKA